MTSEDELTNGLEDVERMNAVASVPLQTTPAATPITTPITPSATLDDVQKQLAKFGREQFKLNTLVETQQKQMQAALQLLIENEIRRERERNDWMTNRADERAQVRLKVAERMLPALDGLDEAIAALERATRMPRPTWWQRLRGANAAAPESLAAWRAGLTIVRDRLLGLLAEEDIYPVESEGEIFDPSLHVALQHAPATREHPVGTVVREVRRGYVIGQVPLRCAEVVVARD